MAWSNETALRFLELYRSHPCIWDPKHVSHKDKSKHNKAWVDIKNKLGGSCTIKELKRKKDSLMASYRSYRTKIKKFELSRKGTSNLYEPSWFAYSYMDTFLGSVYKCKVSMNTEDDQYECKKEYIASVYDTNNIDASNVEVDSVVASSQQHPGKYKRRRYKPAETQPNEVDLQQAKDQMDQAYQILKSVSLVTQEQHSDKDDECIIFGKLIAKKLRKLTEDRRDLMMIKINQLFYEEFYER